MRGSPLPMIALTLIAAPACRLTEPDMRASRQPANFNQHWVYDEQLREIMAGLVRNDWPERDLQSQATEHRRDRAFEDAASLAAALARAGKQLPRLVAHQDMSPADRAAFNEEAGTLHDLARKLQESARKKDAQALQTLLERIDVTCASCHGKFRDFSGVLGPRRVDARKPPAARSTEKDL